MSFLDLYLSVFFFLETSIAIRIFFVVVVDFTHVLFTFFFFLFA